MPKRRKPTPYWTRVIEQAIRRKRAGKRAFTRKQDLAASCWITCACGKQDSQISRYRGGPKDPTLYDLGVRFGDEVYFGNPIKAKRILAKIERRAAEVLKEVLTDA